jgi:UDP-glucose 4-epimerase
MRVLVTGGAGYIGAHTVKRLLNRGDFVYVIDDFSTGKKMRIENVDFHILDLSGSESIEVLSRIFKSEKIDTVIHFAGKKRVDESFLKPSWYLQQNVDALSNVLEAMSQAGVRNIVFSSSAAVYGESVGLVTEESPTNPLNPYGESKLLAERLLSKISRDLGLSAASLRYFNVAGADSSNLKDQHINNLIPIVVKLLSESSSPLIFGTNYPTPDGTCIRDYIHVGDLADAHLAVVDWLGGHKGNEIFNVGTGKGHSVLEVITTAQRLMHKEDVLPLILERRKGDPSAVVASPTKINKFSGWKAEKNLEQIVQSVIDSMR